MKIWVRQTVLLVVLGCLWSVATFAAGGYSAAFVWRDFHERQVTEMVLLSHSARVGNAILTLRALRDEKIDQAIELQERTMDHELFGIDALVERSDSMPPEVLHMVFEVKLYRDKYPREQDDEDLRGAIERLFAEVNGP